jgi:tRNA-2-methylthio-N6-dimethylallyladenosine synthase
MLAASSPRLAPVHLQRYSGLMKPEQKSNPGKTVHIKTYGCQMNVYDSERMGELLRTEGYSNTDNANDADLVILNTCHIREKAAEKMYSDIGRLKKNEARRTANGRETLVAVAGCVAQAEGAEIMRRTKAVNMVFGPQTYHKLPEFLEIARQQSEQGQKPHILDTDFPAEDKFEQMAGPRSAASAAAFLTVQEGCDKFCTFCVVPYTRGAETSRPVQQIETEAHHLVQRGVKEITLLGQNVNAYHGQDAMGNATNLTGLIRRLAKMDGLARLRFMTSHPRDMSDDLIELYGTERKLMPYLHLPVQAGSNRVLRAMNRAHTAESYLATLDKMRHVSPDIALSGDFIVGFPGETEADFQETLELVSKARYAQAYSFKYSPRPGTPAAELDGQVPEDEKADRLTRLQSLLQEQSLAFNLACKNKQFEVLLERNGKLPDQFIGRSPYLQPVHVVAPQAQLGDMVNVTISAASPVSLKGELVTSHSHGMAA